MRYEHLPAYGPTDPFGDEEHEPDVIVRVDFLMSREQVTTALGIAWAEIAGDRVPESLSVVEVRHEVEAYLSVQAFHALGVQMERDGLRVFPPEQQAVMQLLAEAVEQAYPPRPAPPVMQSPRYRDGTVTLQTSDHDEVVVNEPAWCGGHDDEYVGRLADLTHNGAHVTAGVATEGHGYVDVLDAYISHAPFGLLQPEPYPVVSLHLDLDVDVTPDDGMKVARGLRVAAARVERVVAEAEGLRGGGRL